MPDRFANGNPANDNHPETIEKANRNDLNGSLHQANYRIFESVAKRLKQPMEKFPMNIDRYGNTSGASVPLMLDELNREGKLNRGDKIILAGFGGGLTWGAALLEW